MERNDTLGIYLPQKNVLWYIKRQATLYGLLCRRGLRAQRTKQSTRGGNFTLPPFYAPKGECITFGMWGRLLDIMSHAKFQFDRFGGFGAPGGRKLFDYRSIRTNLLHCDYCCMSPRT